MTINDVEINGYRIDKFNQYDLEVGAKDGPCPLCSEHRKPAHQKAKVAKYDWELGFGTCNHCNEVFQLNTFKRKGGKNNDYAIPKIVAEPVSKSITYFESRGISPQTLINMKVGEGLEYMPQVNKEVNTIQFNYYVGGELVNIKYRDGRKNFKLFKGAEKVFYNIDSIVGYKDVVIVEGEIDALSYYEAGIKNVVSVPNGASLQRNNLDYLDNCIDYFTDKEKIYIAVDKDDAGQSLQKELIRRLGAEICYLVYFDGKKDANEFLCEFGKEALKNTIKLATPVPLENVTTFKDIEGDVVDFVKNGFVPGFQIGLDNFDRIFSTYTKQFITVTGIPSSGKSDFVDQMVVGYNLKYGWKTAFASPENAPLYLHAHKLMRKMWEGMPEEDDLETIKWKSLSDHINNNFFFIDMDTYNLESVLRKGAELVKRKGIKCLVIDPYNKVRDTNATSDDVNAYTLGYLTKIEAFVRKYDALAIVVAHPTKMYKGQDGEMQEPNMYNIKGGGEWYDSSYHGLLVHRNYDEKTVKVKVLKVKFQNLGENGAEAHFTWDYKSGLYVPLETEIYEKMPWET